MEKKNKPEETEVIDLEEYAKAGNPVPKGKKYKFRVGKEKFETDREKLKGREILTIAGKLPPENWLLSQKKGKAVIKVELDDIVDLCEPGVERFMVMPKDQTEGESPTLRRQFALPEDEVEGLDAIGLPWETILDGSAMWLLVHRFPLPAGYSQGHTTVAIQIPPNYPIGQLDMVFFHPAATRADGVPIRAADHFQPIDGRGFQRWSRHYTAANPWIPGEYNVLTHLELVRHWLEREFKQAA